MKNLFIKKVLQELERTKDVKPEILTGNDLLLLPEIVRKYILYTGFAGKEKVMNFRAEFKGGIRGKSSEPFMKLKSVQYNFTDRPARLFYITARKLGIPVKGIHVYQNETAIMKIKLFGLYPVVNASGPEMNQGETVTILNDMCVMAPSTLIDQNISWEVIDNLTVRIRFVNGAIAVGAVLYFDQDGRLLNFVSNDRFETTDGKVYFNYPWSTPISEYEHFNGYYLPSKAKLIYKHPDEDFCYGEFELVNMTYNCKDYR